MKTTIYIEGGGNTRNLRSELRQGFHSIFDKTNLKGNLPKVVAGGSRNETFKNFKISFENKEENDKVLLLVDSEDIIKDSSNKWEYVLKRDKWQKPKGAMKDNIFFMVVCMESWSLEYRSYFKDIS